MKYLVLLLVTLSLTSCNKQSDPAVLITLLSFQEKSLSLHHFDSLALCENVRKSIIRHLWSADIYDPYDDIEVISDVPEIICMDATLELDENGEATLIVPDVVVNLLPGTMVVDQEGTFSPIDIDGTQVFLINL